MPFIILYFPMSLQRKSQFPLCEALLSVWSPKFYIYDSVREFWETKNLQNTWH